MSEPTIESYDPVVAMVVISDLEYGGAQRQVVELVNHMNQERFKLHLVSLSSYIPLASSLNCGADRFHVLEKKNKWDAGVVLRLRRLIQKLGVTIVHSFLFDSTIVARLAGGSLGGVAVIDSERNCQNTYKKRHLIAYAATRKFVDRVIANSSAGAEFNEQALGINRSKYRVVHNGVDTVRFRVRHRDECKKAIGIDIERPVVGMFASFKPQKNHPFFFTSMAQVAEQFPDVQILLVGDELHGGMSESIEFKALIHERIDSLGLERRCHLLGNRDDVELIYPACDFTVLPSLFEGTPNVALESMACGVPVIATDVSDNSYVIPDGEVGYIVPVGDEASLARSIEKLLGDSKRLGEMGRKARKWVESEFSCSRLAEKTADVYDELLREKKQRGRIKNA